MDRVAIVATGGTIDHSYDPLVTKVTEPGRVVEMMIDEIASTGETSVDLTIDRWGSKSGPALTPGDLIDIGETVQRLGSAADCSGVVVTTGTDMLEELTYMLSLVVDSAIPVAVTGAMRRHGEPGSDGAMNLRDAIAIVRSPRVPGFGALAVFGGAIHSAAEVTKIASHGLAAFGSDGGGSIGLISEGTLYLRGQAANGHYLGQPTRELKAVDLVWVCAGADSVQIEAAIAARRAGIVVAGSGGGHVPPVMQEAIGRALSEGLQVVVASRCLSGVTLTETYGGPGSETELLALGVVNAGRISPTKARLRLIVGLASNMRAADLFPVDNLGPL
jgi:L-asparaginase